MVHRTLGGLLTACALTGALAAGGPVAHATADAGAPRTGAETGAEASTRAAGAGLDAPPAPDPDHERTPEELAEQQAEAERLLETIGTQAAAVDAARERLLELSEAAGAALEAAEEALRARDAALAEEQHQLGRLEAARELVGAKRGEMGRWASRTYREGGTLADYERLMGALTRGSTDDLAQRLTMLDRVGRMRGGVVVDVTEAEAVQADATRRARDAAAAAVTAAEEAERARQEADRLVTEQATAVGVLESLLSQTLESAGLGAEQLEAARAVAEQRRLEAAARPGGVNAVTGEVGTCLGGDVGRYPNGMIPVDALCPVWGAPGHYLRADAAHAFDQLSLAYATRFGEPLCVTDSYRSHAAQVSVRQRKPHLAAVPGTSHHGWGTAVDLCGGVESFGSPQHEWLRLHAPLHGWYHPRWAQAGGTKPEPWHWEYGG
ncbi:D-alanyl-D-alanine carboxypeptidase family protein [Thalassiella azotivora]